MQPGPSRPEPPARPLGPGPPMRPGQPGRPGRPRDPGWLPSLGWLGSPAWLPGLAWLPGRGWLPGLGWPPGRGWPLEPGRRQRPGPSPGEPPQAGPLPRESGWRRRPARQPSAVPARPAWRRWPVRPPPWAGSSRRRSSTTPCPPNPGRPDSADTSRPRAIRWDRSRCWLAPVVPSHRHGRWLARLVSWTLAAAPEARRTSPSSDGCLADHSPPLRLPGATTSVSGASIRLCQENGPCRAAPASSRRGLSGLSGPG
jgi:hypothetical protein